jgi:hypothetical protein
MTSFETQRDAFAGQIAELTCMASAAFRHLDPEARAEAVQNALALAWKAYEALARQGRGDEAGIIKSCLWYSIRQTRAGRKAEGESRAKDAYKNARKGRVRFERAELNHFVGDETPIPDQVSFRLDVPAFLATLTDRQRHMAEDLMAGETTSSVAERYGVTPGAVSQFRTRFKHLFDSFMAC